MSDIIQEVAQALYEESESSGEETNRADVTTMRLERATAVGADGNHSSSLWRDWHLVIRELASTPSLELLVEVSAQCQLDDSRDALTGVLALAHHHLVQGAVFW